MLRQRHSILLSLAATATMLAHGARASVCGWNNPNDFSSQSAMTSDGWSFGWEDSAVWQPDANACRGYRGWAHGLSYGTLDHTFSGKGAMTIVWASGCGFCTNQGDSVDYVRLDLNGIEVAKAQGNTNGAEQTTKIDFIDGDKLSVTEHYNIICIHEISFSCRCESGQYYDEIAASCKSCTLACSEGSYLLSNGCGADLGVLDNVCLQCPIGSTCLGGESGPSACPKGSFQDQPGKTSCKPCGNDTQSGALGRQTPCVGIRPGFFGIGGTATSHTAEAPCKKGYYCPGGSLDEIICPEGAFCDAPQCETCTPCEAGTVAAAPGATECIPCAEGMYQDEPNQTKCKGAVTCYPGSFVAKEAINVTDRVCTGCDPGFFTTLANQSTCTKCTECSEGQRLSSPCTGTSNRTCSSLPTSASRAFPPLQQMSAPILAAEEADLVLMPGQDGGRLVLPADSVFVGGRLLSVGELVGRIEELEATVGYLLKEHLKANGGA